jgi:hypothetical protein
MFSVTSFFCIISYKLVHIISRSIVCSLPDHEKTMTLGGLQTSKDYMCIMLFDEQGLSSIQLIILNIKSIRNVMLPFLILEEEAPPTPFMIKEF